MKKEKVLSKINYYEKQKENALERYIDSNARKDRDSVIKCRTELKVWKEVLSMIKE